MANERLAQYNTFQENHLGFKGIMAGVASELTPEGYVPDMENLKISVEGMAAAISNPTRIAPPTGQTDLKAMFVWQKDDGTNKLLAQYGANLYIWSGSAWSYVQKNGTTLGVAITNADATSITVVAGTAQPMPFTIKIDSELMSVTAGATGTTWTVTRGTEGTTKATHIISSQLLVPAFLSILKASFASGMLDKLYIAQEATQCMSYDGTTLSGLPNGPMGKYITLWKNRFFIGGVTKFYGLAASTVVNGEATAVTSGDAVMWSNINIVDDLHGGATHDNGWYLGSIVYLKTPESSSCTGIFPIGENLYMFCESAIFQFSGYAESSFSLFDVYHGMNAPKGNAIIGAGSVFYISSDGFFILKEIPEKISIPVKALISTTSSNVSCAYFDSRVWFSSGSTLVALNVGTGAWEKYKFGGDYSGTDYGAQSIVYAADHLYVGTSGTSGGSIFIIDTAASGYRPWYLETPTLNQGITSTDKRYKSLFVYAKNSDDAMNVSFSLNYSGSLGISPSLVGVQIGDLWGVMLWGAEETEGHGHWCSDVSEMTIYKRYIVAPLGRTISFRFSGSGDGALLGYGVVYTPKRKFGVR